jgi:hypothetical protein
MSQARDSNLLELLLLLSNREMMGRPVQGISTAISIGWYYYPGAMTIPQT